MFETAGKNTGKGMTHRKQRVTTSSRRGQLHQNLNQLLTVGWFPYLLHQLILSYHIIHVYYHIINYYLCIAFVHCPRLYYNQLIYLTQMLHGTGIFTWIWLKFMGM